MKVKYLFFGVKKRNGSIQVRKFFTQKDVEAVQADPMTEKILPPFTAEGWPQAEKEVNKWADRTDSAGA